MKPIRFRARGPFHDALRKAVRSELAGRNPTGGVRLAAKAFAILAALAIAYGMLVFATSSVAEWAFWSFVLANAIVCVGFDVMHDAGHGAFSSSPQVNWVLARTLDLIGGNQTLWQRKHNLQHHTYTNLEAEDDDLDTGGLLRMHPDQPWKPHHRYQAYWALPAYSLLALHWIVSDFPEFFGRRVGRHAVPAPSALDTAVFLGGKITWVGLALVLPTTRHGIGVVLGTVLVVYLFVGFVLALVFQLAHVVEDADFVSAASGPVDEWAVHQVNTTVDFATGNPLVTWYCGGLNFQVEHHLFPRIAHTHYPSIRPIVMRVAEEHGVRYRENATLRAAIRSHLRWLAKLGEPPAHRYGATGSRTSSRTKRAASSSEFEVLSDDASRGRRALSARSP